MLDVEFFDGLAPGLALESLLDINWMEYSISLPQLTMCFGHSMSVRKVHRLVCLCAPPYTVGTNLCPSQNISQQLSAHYLSISKRP